MVKNLKLLVGVGLLGLCVVFSGATMISSAKGKEQKEKYSIEIKNENVKKHHVKNLNSVNINADQDSLKNLQVFRDEEGKDWTYCSFLESGLLVDKVREKYSKKAALSFNDVQERIMDDMSQKGDTLPVLLVNEELTQARFIFTRDAGKGKTIVKELNYDAVEETWTSK